MSGWMLVTRELYEAGRPLRANEFRVNATASEPARALREAKRLGLVESRRHHFTWAWHMTAKGNAWGEGLAEVKYLKPRPQGGKRTVCPTWIAPLAGVM